MPENVSISKTGKRFHKAEKLKAQRKMPSVFGWSNIKAFVKAFIKETGFLKGVALLSKSWTWDLIFNKPKWHPEYFEFNNAEEEKVFRKVFDQDSVYLITLFENLKKKYGESRADEILAKVAIPAVLPYLTKVFRPIKNLTHIDQVRQMIADFLGDGKNHEWTEEVSEDGNEVRYHFTKCAHIMVWMAYGMKGFASYACLADHVCFDVNMPKLVFSRKHNIGLGDTFCDHMFRIKSQVDDEKDKSDYEDVFKAKYGAREEIQYWKNVLKKNNF